MNNDISYITNIRVAEEIASKVGRNSNLFFVSSIDVYGTTTGLITHDLKYNPFDSYSKAKVDFESIISRCGKSYVFLFPGLFGGSLEEGSIISRMIKSAITKRKIVISNQEIKRTMVSYQYASKLIVQCWKHANSHLSDNEKSRTLVIPNTELSQPLNFYANFIKDYLAESFQIKDLIIEIDVDSDTSGGRAKDIVLKATANLFEHPPMDLIQDRIIEFIERCLENDSKYSLPCEP